MMTGNTAIHIASQLQSGAPRKAAFLVAVLIRHRRNYRNFHHQISGFTVSGSTTTRVGLIGLTSGRDQAARRARFWSAQVHGSSSSSFCIGQPLTSLARVSAR